MIKNVYDDLGIIDFNKLAKQKQRVEPISLGCNNFDSYLKGGLKPGFITEFCGEAGSGKSQLALQVMLYATLNESRDLIENYSYYISTQKPHSDTRFHQLKQAFLQRNRLENPKDLDNYLILKHATNIHDFNFWLCNDLTTRLESNDKIRVIVIDTMAGICSEFLQNGRGGSTNYDTLERKNFLLKTNQILKKYAHQYNISILVLNNMSSNISDDYDTVRKEKLVPALGLIWSNMVNERFKLKKLKTVGGQRIVASDNDIHKERVKRSFSVKFSPRFPKQKIPFYIENNGIFAASD